MVTSVWRRTRPDRLNVAAALDPIARRRHDGGEGDLRVCSRPRAFDLPTDWRRVDWHGTPPLTSRPGRVAAERLFVIGDASGYVEPFSGEGMATALETALGRRAAGDGSGREWRPSLATQWKSIQRRAGRRVAGHLPAAGLDSSPSGGSRRPRSGCAALSRGSLDDSFAKSAEQPNIDQRHHENDAT